jgi:CRP-like cAMP-binding protein
MALYECIPESRLDWSQKYRQTQFTLKSKGTLYLEGSHPNYIYTLFDGWVAIYKTTAKGKRQILRYALPGDFIGLQSDTDGAVTHSAEAVTDIVLCVFPRASLNDMISSEPALATRLLCMQTRDVSLCHHHFIGAGRKNSQERIAFLLLELFHRTRLQSPQHYNAATNTIDFPLTQEAIGDAVGLTNVHVNRVIREFIKKEYIICKGKYLTILDDDALSDIAEFHVNMLSINSFT